jgi:hypothetical protein
MRTPLAARVIQTLTYRFPCILPHRFGEET